MILWSDVVKTAPFLLGQPSVIHADIFVHTIRPHHPSTHIVHTIPSTHTVHRLQKLLLGRNKISALETLTCVTNLIQVWKEVLFLWRLQSHAGTWCLIQFIPMPLQLSIEDNDLVSLAGIEPLVNLMELYAGEG